MRHMSADKRQSAIRLLCVFTWKNRDHAIHRCAEIPILILNAAFWAGRGGLVKVVKMSVEPAVVNECSGMRKKQRERSWNSAVTVCAFKQHIRAVMPSGIEKVVAHDSMVVGI